MQKQANIGERKGVFYLKEISDNAHLLFYKEYYYLVVEAYCLLYILFSNGFIIAILFLWYF